DVAALSEALGRLAVDEGLRTRLGAAAQRRAAGLSTWAESAARFFEVVREAVS
ncbi:MAG: glycosyltransferase family 1 protein, partial [Acidimicrobiia bacterium]|nr:glycosyltransferase family 1 protein [Acidimicrobiia bacterium]